MATYSLRCFSRPEGLKAISPRHLRAFLSRHEHFLADRGVALPSGDDPDHFDYEALATMFMSPDASPPAPKELLDALFFVDEMATPEAMNELLEDAEKLGLKIDGDPDPTPADVAVQVWLQNREVLERRHAEQFLRRPRSFEYFRMNRTEVPAFEFPTPGDLRPLESALDDWFEKKKRGRGSRVFVFPRGSEVWFLVRHGEPFKREGSIEKGESSSVFYRPEKYDVLVYDTKAGEIRMNAASKGEKELYRQQFGLYLFGSEDFFLGEAKYTLEPLRSDGEDALVCTEIDGLEWVKLKEIRYRWGGAYGEIEIRKAEDIFAALKAQGRTMPGRVPIVAASFLVRFADVKTPRTVSIRAGNVAQYTRDDDSVVIENWLVKRKFLVTAEEEERESAEMAVAGP